MAIFNCYVSSPEGSSQPPTPNPAAVLVAFPLPVPLRQGLHEAPRRFFCAELAAEATERAQAVLQLLRRSDVICIREMMCQKSDLVAHPT